MVTTVPAPEPSTRWARFINIWRSPSRKSLNTGYPGVDVSGASRYKGPTMRRVSPPRVDLPKPDPFDLLLTRHAPRLARRPLLQTTIPALAKDASAVRTIEKLIKRVPTDHQVYLGDARDMGQLRDESIHLVVTSPPYWTLKVYPTNEAQLGGFADYDEFLKELHRVWSECYRVLVPGGRLIAVVGDVCLSRRKHGAHMVVPLHAAIQEDCRHIGFHNLAPIIWHKIANAAFEVDNGTSFLGKPYEPNAVIKNDIEFILMQRKPGGYRQPSDAVRLLSMIGERRHRAWFNQIVRVHGASTRQHPAPYPIELAERLIRMFSFVGDRVLDPFLGTASTSVAAARWGRNSVGIEIEPTYHHLAIDRLRDVVAREKLPATIAAEPGHERSPA